MNILLIEDDQEAANCLRFGLMEAGHDVAHEANGEAGLQTAKARNFDVLVVDRMLPRLDGLSIIRALREAGQMTPTLVLSALGEVDDRIAGLRAGGDDYLVKPYVFGELLARLEALQRRGQTGTVKDELTVGDLSLNLLTHEVQRAGHPIRLQPKELRLLEYLMRHANQLVTRNMLLEKVWGLRFDPATSIIDTQISRLRSKIDKGFDPALLHTIRGKGFMLGNV